VHVGGLGRGKGWAGNVDLILATEDLARESMTSGVPVFARAAEPVHVFGRTTSAKRSSYRSIPT
jgi:hypothetical protein